MPSLLCWKVQQRTCVAFYPRGKKNSGWVRFFPGEGKRTVKKKQSAWEQTFVEWTHQQGKQPQQDTSNSEPNPIELILLGPIMWAQLHALLWTLLQPPWFSKSCFSTRRSFGGVWCTAKCKAYLSAWWNTCERDHKNKFQFVHLAILLSPALTTLNVACVAVLAFGLQNKIA